MLSQISPNMHYQKGIGKVLTVVVGNIGGQTADLGRRASKGQNLSEEFSSGGKVVVPAQPATVGCIQVESDVGELELFDGIGDALLVGVGGVGTLLDSQVGDQIGK